MIGNWKSIHITKTHQNLPYQGQGTAMPLKFCITSKKTVYEKIFILINNSVGEPFWLCTNHN